MTTTSATAPRKDRLTRRPIHPVDGPLISCLSDHTMEGPYSARFPSSSDGETSRRAPVIRGAADERSDTIDRHRHLRGGGTDRRGRACAMSPDDDREFAHRPVMADEIVELFGPVPAGWVIDATLGGAGHATAVLTAHPHLKVLGIDQRSRRPRRGPGPSRAASATGSARSEPGSTTWPPRWRPRFPTASWSSGRCSTSG